MQPTQASLNPQDLPLKPVKADRPQTSHRLRSWPADLDHLWSGLQAGRWLRELPQDLGEQLKALARPRQLAAAEWLFRRGDPTCGLYAVARGTLCISGTLAQGGQTRTALLSLADAPMWLGEVGLFDGTTRSHDVQAVTACTLLHIPQAPLLAWLQQHPAHWQNMALLLTDKLRACMASFEEQLLLPAPQRLIRRLVRMAQGLEQWYEPYEAEQPLHSRRELQVSQEQLARMLGLSRQTTNQILQTLQQSRLIRLRRAKLEILDLQGLRLAGD